MFCHPNILIRSDFEDTYDGLGDHLDETLDEYNDETFGTSAVDVGESPSSPPGSLTRRKEGLLLHANKLTGRVWTGRDFDFFGKTAKIADVMEEEQMTYNRSHVHQPPPTQAARQAPPQHQRTESYGRQQKQPQQANFPIRNVPSYLDATYSSVSLGAHLID